LGKLDPPVHSTASRRGSGFWRDVAPRYRCGPGYVSAAAAERGAIPTGLDFSKRMLATETKMFPQIQFRVRSGGKFGFTVWARAEESPYARIIDDAIAAHANVDVDVPADPPHHLYSGREEFRQALERAGLDGSSLVFKLHTIEWNVPTTRFVFDAERNAGVRIAGLLARQTPQALRAIQSAIEKAVTRCAKGDGFAIPKAAYVVGASKK
jgi:hypothetical protein